jgi:hypothetical protein
MNDDVEAADPAAHIEPALAVQAGADPAASPASISGSAPGLSAAPELPAAPGLSAAELDALAVELADVESALGRLASGDYRRCEVTGEAIPEALLVANPLLRRAPSPA